MGHFFSHGTGVRPILRQTRNETTTLELTKGTPRPTSTNNKGNLNTSTINKRKRRILLRQFTRPRNRATRRNTTYVTLRPTKTNPTMTSMRNTILVRHRHTKVTQRPTRTTLATLTPYDRTTNENHDTPSTTATRIKSMRNLNTLIRHGTKHSNGTTRRLLCNTNDKVVGMCHTYSNINRRLNTRNTFQPLFHALLPSRNGMSLTIYASLRNEGNPRQNAISLHSRLFR